MKLHVAWCWPQPTIKYFHLARFTKLLQKNWKEECEEKKKRIEREADSQYVEGVIDVEWERNGEREKKSCSGKKKEKKKILVFIFYFFNIYYIWIIKNLGAFSIWEPQAIA